MTEPNVEQTETRPPYPRLHGLPPELSHIIIDLLSNAAQKQLHLVNKAFHKLTTPHIFKYILIPETAGRKKREIPTHLIVNATSITIPKRTDMATKISQPFIRKLFSNAQVNQVCIQHPIPLPHMQIILNILGTRLRSLAITGEAFRIAFHKWDDLKFLETCDAITELKQLRLTPMWLRPVIGEAEENIIATLIHRSSNTLRSLDLSWGSPIQLIAIPGALNGCRNLTGLNLNGYRQCANMLPSLLANNPRLKGLCLQGADIADEPTDGNVASAFRAFTGSLTHLEITCLRSLPDWFPSTRCLDNLNILAIETENADAHLAQWICHLSELRDIKFISTKFETSVDYTKCFPRVTVLQLHNLELSLASLGELIQPMLALTSLTFFDVYLIDHTEWDFIRTTLDRPAVQNLRDKFRFEEPLTTATNTDIAMRLWLHSKSKLVPDDEPVPPDLRLKWEASRSQDNGEAELSEFESDELISTDEEFGIEQEGNENGDSEKSDDDDDGGDDDAFAKALDEALAAPSPSSSSVTSRLTFSSSLDADEQLARQLQVQEELLVGEDQRTASSSPVVSTKRGSLNASNKRDRIKLGDKVSDDDERSGKRLCMGESKVIDSPSSTAKITFNRSGKDKNKSKRIEKIVKESQETASSSSVVPMERGFSNKRDRIKLGSTISDDDEQSGKRLCTDQSNPIGLTANITFNLGGKGKTKDEGGSRMTIKQQAKKMMDK